MTAPTSTRRPSYFGVAIDNGKTESNLGTVWRTAANFGAAFTAQIGGRYKRQASDTMAAYRQLPHHTYTDPQDWRDHIPHACVPVAVEIRDDAVDLRDYKHPAAAVYVVGPEDGGVRREVLTVCRDVIVIPSNYCLNQAVAASIVMWDRLSKLEAR